MCQISHYLTAYNLKNCNVDYELKDAKHVTLVIAKCNETKDTLHIKTIKYISPGEACHIQLLLTEIISRAKNWDKTYIKGSIKVLHEQGELIEKCLREKKFKIEMATFDKIVVFRQSID
jgi:hypothetical protein